MELLCAKVCEYCNRPSSKWEGGFRNSQFWNSKGFGEEARDCDPEVCVCGGRGVKMLIHIFELTSQLMI